MMFLLRAGHLFWDYSDKNFFDKAVTNGWLSTDTLLNTPATYNNKFDLSARALVEPFPGNEN